MWSFPWMGGMRIDDDAEGHQHGFVDKVPMLMNGEYDAGSQYPTPDTFCAVKVFERYQDKQTHSNSCAWVRPNPMQSSPQFG